MIEVEDNEEEYNNDDMGGDDEDDIDINVDYWGWLRQETFAFLFYFLVYNMFIQVYFYNGCQPCNILFLLALIEIKTWNFGPLKVHFFFAIYIYDMRYRKIEK